LQSDSVFIKLLIIKWVVVINGGWYVSFD